MKDKLTAGLLAIFVGGLGIHKFYLGDSKKGVLYICLCWTGVPGILATIDGIKLLTMSDEEFNATYNSGEKKNDESDEETFCAEQSDTEQPETQQVGTYFSLDNLSSKLMTYKKLLDDGLITREEFEQLKQKALS